MLGYSQLVRQGLEKFEYVAERYRVEITARPNRDAFDNRHGKGNLEDELGAHAGIGDYIHLAPYAFKVFLDNVHAHAAARHFGHDVCRGESGLEDKLPYILVGNRVRVSGDESHRDRLFKYFFLVEAVAVVFYAYPDFRAFVFGVQVDYADFGFSRRHALLFFFHAVVYRISDYVHKRVGYLLDDVLVHLGILARYLEVDRLVEFAGQVAHQSGHFLEQSLEGDHPDHHGGFLDFP